MNTLVMVIERPNKPQPYGEYNKPPLVRPIGEDEKENNSPPSPFKEAHIGFFASLSSFLRKIREFLLGKRGSSDVERLQAEGRVLRGILLQLAAKDMSYDAHFLAEFSSAWRALDNACAKMTLDLPFVAYAKDLLRQIASYPPGSEYTLGYYFRGEAGEDWTPFPCMEVLRDLHVEYNTSSETSTLGLWLSLCRNLY